MDDFLPSVEFLERGGVLGEVGEGGGVIRRGTSANVAEHVVDDIANNGQALHRARGVLEGAEEFGRDDAFEHGENFATEAVDDVEHGMEEIADNGQLIEAQASD